MSTNWLFGSVLFGGTTASFYKDVVFVALFSGCISYDPGTGTPEAPAAIALPGVALVAFGGVLLARRRTRNRVGPRRRHAQSSGPPQRRGGEQQVLLADRVEGHGGLGP